MSRPNFRLLEIRKTLRLSQPALGKILGNVSKHTMVNWEKNYPYLTFDQLRILDQIGINVPYFWGSGDILKPGTRLIDAIQRAKSLLETQRTGQEFKITV